MYKRILSLILVSCICSFLLLPTSATSEKDTAPLSLDEDISTTAVNKDVIIIVPGIMGSELKYGSTLVWSPNDSSESAIKCFKWIACDETGASSYTITPYIGDSYGTQETYETLYTTLYNAYNSSTCDVKFFAYDWRLSCVSAAESLRNLISGYNGKIYIVAHSMGGLVASQYIKNATTSQKNRTTIITLGTPFQGSPKAVNVFENGAMFDDLIGILIVNSFVKSVVPNFPSAYELLPTIRHPFFLMKEESTLTYASSMSFLKTRDWALKSNGTVKPMFSTADNFLSNLGYGSSHVIYNAANVYHIVSDGHDTVSKVNYRLDGGSYRTDYLAMSNAGDGTVLTQSARNGLAASNSKVFTYSTIGDHTGMVSNPTVLNKIKSLINSTRSSSVSSIPSIQDQTTLHSVNDRGWIVGDEFDNRRIIVNINHGGCGELYLSSGEAIQNIGESLFYTNQNGTEIRVGSLLKTGTGYQYVLYDNSYSFSCPDISESSDIVIRYLNDGYYEKIEEYNELPDTPISISISGYQSKFNQVSSLMSCQSNDIASFIPVSKNYSLNELNILNAQ